MRIAAANGVGKVIVGVDFLMSTPCVSGVIREQKAYGGIILTASHNPGGPDEDFGIKYNCANGGPAPSGLTNEMFRISKEITEYSITKEVPEFDASKPGVSQFGGMEIEVIDAAAAYAALMKGIFDFDKLKKFVARDDFSFIYDSMHGVAGPFAKKIFVDILGAPESVLMNGVPKVDFGGGHPDPNLTYAHELVHAMGLDAKSKDADDKDVPDFGAAADGDADRNMVLGKKFFVTPSDSVAIIAANSSAIPYFKDGLKGVARSMPTSAALDCVAKKLDLPLFEVPTGWKYFGNLMDAGKISVCGEESFGTGSDHIREKDGMWAVLCWLSILQAKNENNAGALVTVEDIVREHWKTYGRNYYCRYDYEQVDATNAKTLMAQLVELTEQCTAGTHDTALFGEYKIASADEFEYKDPVDGSVASHQGIRFVFTDGSRVVFRLSGTGSVGATIRMYIEQYSGDTLSLDNLAALKPLIDIGVSISKMKELTGRDEPTVIT